MAKKRAGKIKKFIKNNKIFCIILLVAVLARIAFLFLHKDIWWDSGVYAGMGKFLFSLGKAGLWEHIRPVFLPVFLGFFWKIGLDVVLSGKILLFLGSAGSIILVYLISKKIFDKRTALIASAIFSFSAVFFFMNFHLYTEIPSVFFVLAGVYAFLDEKNFSAGIFLGLAFLAKFPAAMFFIIILGVLAFSKDIKKVARLCYGFAVPVLPFLIANQIAYGNFLAPLIDASNAIGAVLGCNYLWFKPWHWYFRFIAFSENFLHVFSILGIYFVLKKPKLKKVMLLLLALLPFAYFLQLHCRDWRYLVVVMPFIAMLTGYGINRLIKQREHFMPVLVLVIVFSAVAGMGFYVQNTSRYVNDPQQGYFEFLHAKEVRGEVWSSNPMVAMHSDEKINKIYYPVFGADVALSFYDYLRENPEKIQYVFLDNCGGGIICHPEDKECAANLANIHDYLDENYNLAYDRSFGRCEYKIYKN
jgi:hypothetical protein